jgi:hypothetical protein
MNYCKRFSRSAKILRPALKTLLEISTNQVLLYVICYTILYYTMSYVVCYMSYVVCSYVVCSYVVCSYVVCRMSYVVCLLMPFSYPNIVF